MTAYIVFGLALWVIIGFSAYAMVLCAAKFDRRLKQWREEPLYRMGEVCPVTGTRLHVIDEAFERAVA